MKSQNRFLVIGHRGAASYEHDNTMASFEKAIECGADMIEFDIRKTADGRLIVFHDRTIKTEWGRAPVSKLTYDQVRQAALLDNFTVPEFKDVLSGFGKRIAFNIEIKARGFEKDILGQMRKFKLEFNPVISSFLPWVVSGIKKIDHSLNVGLIIGKKHFHRFGYLNTPVFKPLSNKLGLYSVHLEDSLVNQHLVNRMRGLGLKIIVWTVDDKNRMIELIGMGVDGIISNSPDVLRSVSDSLKDTNQKKTVKISITDVKLSPKVRKGI